MALLLERVFVSWGVCLAAEWVIDPSLARVCAEVLGVGRVRHGSRREALKLSWKGLE